MMQSRGWMPEDESILHEWFDWLPDAHFWFEGETPEDRRLSDGDYVDEGNGGYFYERYKSYSNGAETPNWLIKSDRSETHYRASGDGYHEPHEPARTEVSYIHTARHKVTGEKILLDFDSCQPICKEYAEALGCLLEAGFRPDASWFGADSLEGPEACVLDALRRIHLVPAGDEAMLRRHLAKKLIEVTKTADFSKNQKLSNVRVIDDEMIYIYFEKLPHWQDHGHMLMTPDGKWRVLRARWGGGPYPEHVVKAWYDFGLATNESLREMVLPVTLWQYHKFNLLEAVYDVLMQYNCTPTDPDAAHVLLKVVFADEDRWFAAVKS